MVKFTVRHSCGHEVPHAFSGNETERARREQWLRERPCQVCWHADQSRAAADQLEAWNLPPLEGSDEEKAWAEVIRLKAISHSRDYHARVTDPRKFGPGEEAMKEAVVNAANEALKQLENQASAKWWIDNRFDSLNYLKQRIVDAVTPILNKRNAR